MGYLSLGDSVRLRAADADAAYAGPGDGRDCRAWYAVEPAGFVCAGSEATLDANDPAVVELVRTRADASSPWPYRYGESLGAPVLEALPPPGENQPAQYQRGAEGRVPPLFALGAGGRLLVHHVARGSTVAYTDAFDYLGRSYLLGWDRGVIDRAKVTPYPLSRFHGVALGGDVRLPIAFFRRDGGADKLRRAGDGFEATGERWPRLGWAMLSGRSEAIGRERFYETREGAWLSGAQAGVAAEATELPLSVQKKSGRRSWLDVSIVQGTLVAYEDRTPVYATLISPGRGGMPTPGVPTLKTAATPTGVFGVLGKFVTATMVSSSVSTLIHTEVQYTQNFEGPYALHGAYWHDRWGEYKSGGCVNLSPIDSRRIFAWTDPPLPEGWHGMKSMAFASDRTSVAIHR